MVDRSMRLKSQRLPIKRMAAERWTAAQRSLVFTQLPTKASLDTTHYVHHFVACATTTSMRAQARESHEWHKFLPTRTREKF